MDSRERLLTAVSNEKPDRLPCQVHSWMGYYLSTYLGGIDQYAAYERFGMDSVIYVEPEFIFGEKDRVNWRVEHQWLGVDKDGVARWRQVTTTPERTLVQEGGNNQCTGWVTKYPIESEEDFDIWIKYCPIPEKVDWRPVIQAKERIGRKGIVRGAYYHFGQGSPWQSLCAQMGTEPAIMAAIDRPDWVKYALDCMLKKQLTAIERGGRFVFDVVETGGGAGSNTVISPKMHREFCLPYDKKLHAAIHNAGAKVVYHLCGGVMHMLDIVAENGADGLETMTPPSMGGDCDLAEASRRVGDKLFFIGGFDQNAGFERGTPETVKQLVYKCHQDRPNGGYICSPSDHFFNGDLENIQAFVDAARECIY